MSAVSSVFAIPELLQQILSELPPLNIVRLQLVCRTWHELITTSPLLQYRTWRNNDYPGESASTDDVIPKPGIFEFGDDPKRGLEYDLNRYVYNMTKHMNPIIVSVILKDMPDDPSCPFEYREYKQAWYLNFRPVLLRDLVEWKTNHKDSEHQWGKMSLCRPDTKKIDWEVPCSDGSGIPFELEAVREGKAQPNWGILVNEKVAPKKEGEELILTMSDLMSHLDALWYRWVESEQETHYLSHDGGYCDMDEGLPSESCLDSDKEEEEVDEDGESFEDVIIGTKMTYEEHLEQCIRKASS